MIGIFFLLARSVFSVECDETLTLSEGESQIYEKSLKKGKTICIQNSAVTKISVGMIGCSNCQIQAKYADDTGSEKLTGWHQEDGKITGFNNANLVMINALKDTDVSFGAISFPVDCTYKVISSRSKLNVGVDKEDCEDKDDDEDEKALCSETGRKCYFQASTVDVNFQVQFEGTGIAQLCQHANKDTQCKPNVQPLTNYKSTATNPLYLSWFGGKDSIKEMDIYMTAPKADPTTLFVSRFHNNNFMYIYGEKNNGLSTGAIIGIVIAAVVVVGVIIGVTVFCIIKKRNA
ncbi:hypothetical protein TRFO_26675 [Tritrichomonas foetus]|uniref:Uncharacterized protein n=1 Tax=Tritrichomonas foetus TaxID=1144522 RepID=A0A1J4K3I7_9EUKA|nr:hypothetical protein TRFO_26675 [Tritrichomonas foetus]|eukprot:OHT05538.1 hypothetical protein TRFO_26675 [Tritrichomonas foetus]